MGAYGEFAGGAEQAAELAGRSLPIAARKFCQTIAKSMQPIVVNGRFYTRRYPIQVKRFAKRIEQLGQAHGFGLAGRLAVLAGQALDEAVWFRVGLGRPLLRLGVLAQAGDVALDVLAGVMLNKLPQTQNVLRAKPFIFGHAVEEFLANGRFHHIRLVADFAAQGR